MLFIFQLEVVWDLPWPDQVPFWPCLQNLPAYKTRCSLTLHDLLQQVWQSLGCRHAGVSPCWLDASFHVNFICMVWFWSRFLKNKNMNYFLRSAWNPTTKLHQLVSFNNCVSRLGFFCNLKLKLYLLIFGSFTIMYRLLYRIWWLAFNYFCSIYLCRDSFVSTSKSTPWSDWLCPIISIDADKINKLNAIMNKQAIHQRLFIFEIFTHVITEHYTKQNFRIILFVGCCWTMN